MLLRRSPVCVCNGLVDVQNCFTKGLSPGCTLPADTDPVDNGWLLLSDTKCTPSKGILLMSLLHHSVVEMSLLRSLVRVERQMKV